MIENETDQQVTARLDGLAPLEGILQHFGFIHLPDHLRAASRPFAEHAIRAVVTLPRNAERSAGLRKLLEAKDCFVRAVREGADRQARENADLAETGAPRHKRTED